MNVQNNWPNQEKFVVLFDIPCAKKKNTGWIFPITKWDQSILFVITAWLFSGDAIMRNPAILR